MSNDFNQCIFTGRLGAMPETRYSPDGTIIVNFRIAINSSWKGKDETKEKKTEWVNIVVFGKLAEIAAKYLQTGSFVLISGKLQTRQWEDKDKNKRYTTEVVASVIQMLGAKEEKTEEKPIEETDCPF